MIYGGVSSCYTFSGMSYTDVAYSSMLATCGAVKKSFCIFQAGVGTYPDLTVLGSNPGILIDYFVISGGVFLLNLVVFRYMHVYTHTHIYIYIYNRRFG